MDLQEAFDAGFVAVKAYCDQTFSAFEARLAAVEARAPLQGERGPAGADGPSEDHVAEIVRAAVAAMPPAKDGESGLKGDPGEHGRDGKDGRDAPAVTREILLDVLLPTDPSISSPLKAAVAEFLMAFPPAAGRDGNPGKDGKDGSSGVSVAGAVIDRDGNLTLTLSDGAAVKLGLVIGRDGAPGENGLDGRAGKDGLDGFGFEDMSVEYDGERDLRIVFEKGESRKEFLVPLAHPLDRGVWKAGAYQKADGVTFDGSWWIAQKETTAQPGTSPDWRLAVKRGRHGKDGIVKTLPPPGPVKASG